MAKDFTFTVTYEHPADVVHQALTSPELWESRVEGAHNARVDTESNEPGTLEVTVTQNIASEKLPALARKALKGDLSIVRTDKWGPFDGSTAQGTFTAQSTGISSNTEGVMTLQADGGQATLTVEGRSEIKARLIGGALEPMLVQMLSNLVKSERAGTDKWIAGRTTD